MRSRTLLAALLAAATLPVLAAAAPLRTSTPADDAPHAGGAGLTEWWYANAIDPRSGLAIAVSVGPSAAGAAAASVAFAYLPGGGVHALVAPRLFGRSVTRTRSGGPDVRLGPDRFTQTGPGAWRVRVDLSEAVAVYGGSPGPVRVDLTLRARTPGFIAGPIRYAGQRMSWTVAAPAATADGTVTVGRRTWRLRDAPAYHDHNFGPFDLTSTALAGWDWAQLHLPGGRALTVGLVKPARTAERDGGVVLSDRRRRVAVAGAERFRVTYADWRRAGGFWYPGRERVLARLSDGSVASVRLRAVSAAPLGRGGMALMEILARGEGTIRRGAHAVLRFRAAPGFYEYQSTALGRRRDGAP